VTIMSVAQEKQDRILCCVEQLLAAAPQQHGQGSTHCYNPEKAPAIQTGGKCVGTSSNESCDRKGSDFQGSSRGQSCRSALGVNIGDTSVKSCNIDLCINSCHNEAQKSKLGNKQVADNAKSKSGGEGNKINHGGTEICGYGKDCCSGVSEGVCQSLNILSGIISPELLTANPEYPLDARGASSAPEFAISSATATLEGERNFSFGRDGLGANSSNSVYVGDLAKGDDSGDCLNGYESRHGGKTAKLEGSISCSGDSRGERCCSRVCSNSISIVSTESSEDHGKSHRATDVLAAVVSGYSCDWLSCPSKIHVNGCNDSFCYESCSPGGSGGGSSWFEQEKKDGSHFCPDLQTEKVLLNASDQALQYPDMSPSTENRDKEAGSGLLATTEPQPLLPGLIVSSFSASESSCGGDQCFSCENIPPDQSCIIGHCSAEASSKTDVHGARSRVETIFFSSQGGHATVSAKLGFLNPEEAAEP
jgi:hypothetical protein